MKVIIIEDEALAAMRLKTMIHEYNPQIEILAELESVAESVQWLNENEHPDLIFLDIHLEDDLSFAIFEKVNVDSPIIFTTAFDEYAIKAFKLKSIDYLLKPIAKDELHAALKKYESMVGDKAANKDLQALYSMIVNKEKKYKSRFSVSLGSKIKTFTIDEIAYFISEEGYTCAYLWSGNSYPIDISLNKLIADIDPEQFFRINRQMLVNINAIQDIHIYSNSRLKLDLKPKTADNVFVSIDKTVEFKRWIGAKN
jgi:DNA-binding LytR/AlgR family response regulator